jgi:hypothetical protein
MTLNASGPISLAGTTSGQSIEVENTGNGTTQISMNDTAVRTLLGVSSGAISMSSAYGKSYRPQLTYTYCSGSGYQNTTFTASSLSGYKAGFTDIVITVNPGVYIWSSSTGSAALTITGATSGDTIKLINKGYIMGQGGGGGGGGSYTGASGYTAISLGYNVTIDNTYSSGYIGGGGGGGGGAYTLGTNYYGGGGGAGGGNGGSSHCSGGGGGGSIGNSGTSAANIYSNCGGANAGGGGGRIFPGTTTALSTQGLGGQAGGGGGGYNTPSYGYSYGGQGGGSNNNGTSPSHCAASCGVFGGGGGGGWGAAGALASSNSGHYGGGTGGYAVALNGHSISFASCCKARVWGFVG